MWTDGDVSVTATLVDHTTRLPQPSASASTPPTGSVTISGDTTDSQNMVALTTKTDYLVHEVIDPRFVEQLLVALPPAQAAGVRQHLLESHTIEQVVATSPSRQARRTSS